MLSKAKKIKIQKIIQQLNKEQNVEEISRLLQHCTLTDLGLGRGSLPGGLPRDHWVYLPIAETRKFVFAVFGLRQGQRLPLHDHPQMTVLMKPLLGSMRMRSFSAKVGNGQAHVWDEKTEIMDQTTGVVGVRDIHEITAVTDCAFADVVFPPYDEYGERSISYFEETQDKGILKVVPCPRDNKSVRIRSW